MPKKEVAVRVGWEVKNKCPVCGGMNTEFPSATRKQVTLAGLRNIKRSIVWCSNCKTEFWLHLRTGKITVKWVDKDHVV